MQPTCPTSGSSSNRAEDEQFARFLEAANRLGENLEVIFNASFEKLVWSSTSSAEADDDMARLGPSSDHPMPLPPEQEVLCARLEKGESCPVAAKVIRQQAHEIADLLARLNRAYARVPDEPPSEIIQEAAVA
jgi:hypothetical protein